MTDDRELTHLDEQGRMAMVDVGDKAPTRRVAVARAEVSMEPATRDLVAGDGLHKGDALAAVRLAAVQGAKRTPDLIPLCHPLPIDRIDVDVAANGSGFEIVVTVGVTAKTGVEMEAMAGAAVGALTLYDMIKSVDRSARIVDVRLVSKSGGRSGEWVRD